ncbi:MAG: hypothetical protein EAZ85_04545 [Bacteroidetes bacterium]|nr:MAG: hypothetical protein EAZ85_04545 [Bacteroidota bacterium]TAG90719.1 MAG: hypothetical protein EAZ20_03795 [Bacteroidota bacterium]
MTLNGQTKEAKSNFRINFLALFRNTGSIHYEYQFKQNSLNVNANYTFAGDRIGLLGGLNYRYYLSKNRSSLFLGIVANYSGYAESVSVVPENNPSATPNTPIEFKYNTQTFLPAAQVGYRLNILRIFNFTLRFGYGLPVDINSSWQSPGNTNLSPVSNDRTIIQQRFYSFASWDGEFSFGIRF